MPNTKSAKKRLKQNIARRTRNRAVKASLKTHVRHVREAVADANLEDAATRLRATAKELDQAASKRIIHANKAARLKSRLSAALKAAKTAKPA